MKTNAKIYSYFTSPTMQSALKYLEKQEGVEEHEKNVSFS